MEEHGFVTDLGDCHGYVTGLEPATNFAYNRAKEREAGRVKTLGPGEEVTFALAWSFLRNASEVTQVVGEIEAREGRGVARAVEEEEAAKGREARLREELEAQRRAAEEWHAVSRVKA